MLMKKIKLFFTAMALVLAATTAFAQNLQISGVVTDSTTGEVVAGVAIVDKATKAYTITDAKGAYKISAPADGALLVSCLGYIAQDVDIAGRAVLDIALVPDTQMIDETIVVAFGQSTKEAFTGSATVVKSEEIAKVQASDATRALEGKVAGVQMTTSSGSLGSSPTLRIRGTSSISAGNTPLYVIDGVPYSGDMNNINSADIESMTILKDAASNALYGSRGANGVIMITTKKAAAGRAVVNVEAKVGVNTKALQTYDYITDPRQYYEAYYLANYNYFTSADGLGLSPADAYYKAASTIDAPLADGGLGYKIFTAPAGQLLIGTDGKFNPNATLGRVVNYNGVDYLVTPDNWMDEAYTTSIRQEYNASVQGGNDKGTFFASLGYLNNKGIILGESMDRFTARMRADYQIKKWLKVGGNMAYTHYNWRNGNGEEGSGSTGNIFAFANSIAPVYPLYIRNADGSHMYDDHGLIRYDYGNGANAGFFRAVQANANGLQAVTLDKNETEGNALTANGYAEVRFLKDFTFTVNAGMALDESRGKSLSNSWYGQFVTDGGTLEVSHGRSWRINFQQLLNYSHAFGEHHVSALVGHEYYKSTSTSLSGYKKKLFSMDNLELNGAVVDGASCGSSSGIYNNEGYFVRAQYDYANRYFFSASYRRDASSRFHPDHRWGNFWSVGLGWLINKEKFFNVPWVDMLKVKASIGSQGNDNIGDYLYIDTYGISNSNDEIAVVFSNKGNENITWETNTNFNSGVDFDLFQGRLSGSVEGFYRLTSDMLFWFTVPQSLGYSGYYDNIGNMRNAGVEISLNGTLVRTHNVVWDIYANATHYTNKITMLPEERKTVTIEGYSGYSSGNKFIGEGLPLYTFKLRQYAGVDPATGLSSWYKDVKDDKGNIVDKVATTKYSDATEYLCSDPTPKLYGGFGTSLEAYGFDLSVSFSYSIGGLTYDSGYAGLMTVPGGTPGYNFHKDVLKAWSPENPDSNIPRFQAYDQNVNGTSDRFLIDASYLNFQNAQIGYTFPKKWMDKIKVSKLRLFVTADNIYYWSKRKGLDPRMSFTGSTSDEYCSPVRTVSGGISITF